jgi:hypothetical protein
MVQPSPLGRWTHRVIERANEVAKYVGTVVSKQYIAFKTPLEPSEFLYAAWRAASGGQS